MSSDKPLNGARSPLGEAIADQLAEPAPAPNPLGVAIERHARAIVASHTQVNGQVAINPLQLVSDLELTAARVEGIFEALVERGLLDSGDMVARLTAKLNAQAEEIEGLRNQLLVPNARRIPPPPSRR